MPSIADDDCSKKDPDFIGYTYNKEFEKQNSYLLKALLDIENESERIKKSPIVD